MHSLDVAQSNFIETINLGPDKLDAALFCGPPDRILLGLSAHANTISHARLIALEETFPLTRQHIGQEAFNAVSRDFCETPAAQTQDSNAIGGAFPDFLTLQDMAAQAVELARIEWAWLQSYHAAEREPLALAELGGMDEAALLSLPVALHPSARHVCITMPLAEELEEFGGLQPAAILTLRPHTQVRILPINAAQLAVSDAAMQKNGVLGNLLNATFEIDGETAPLGPVMDLIAAGAVVRDGAKT